MKLTPLTPIQYVISKTKQELILSSLTGNYKNYSESHKLLAEQAVKHFDDFIKAPYEKVKVPLFSQEGFNILKTFIKDTFRKKTPEEKLFRKMIFEYKIKNRYKL